MSETEQDFSWNSIRAIRVYEAELQRQIEAAFKRLSEKYRLPDPLLYSHNELLQCLYYQGKPISLVDVARETGQAMPNVSVGVKELIKNGLVVSESMPGDKRRKMIALSAFGRELCDNYVAEDLPRICARLLDGIPDEMHRIVKEYYKRIEKNVLLIQNGFL